MKDQIFPHKMEKGVFKGRVFETKQDYTDALRAHRNGTPEKTNGHVEAKEIRRITELYDELRSEGLGRERIVRFIEIALR